MSTSGVSSYIITRDQLITAALIECGVIDPEFVTTPTATAISNAATALNMMVRTWIANGLQLWEKRYVAVFLQKGQGVYTFGLVGGGVGGDHATVSNPLTSGFVQTTVAGASGFNITLTSVITQLNTVGNPDSTIAGGWFIGMQQTDGTMFWTTVNSIVGNVVTVAAQPTVGTYTGAFCVSYQTKLFKPLRVLDGFVRQTQSNQDVPVKVISMEEYNRYGNKASAGTSIQVMYDPQLYTGNLYLYPTPQDVTQVMYVQVQRPVDAFVSGTDNYDIPEEWVEALKYGLAHRLSTPYGVPKQKRDEIAQNAQVTYALLDAWDQEPASILIQPDNWSYYYGTSR